MTNCVVSTMPDQNIPYTDGIIALTDEELSEIARAVSDNADVTSATTEVWVSGVNRHISVGCVMVRMIDGDQYSFRLMGFNHYPLTSPLAYGEVTRTGKAGLLFQMTVSLPRRCHITARSNTCFVWRDSALRKVCGRLRRHLPEQTQPILKQVRIPATANGEDEQIESVDDLLFIPSEYEVFGRSAFARVDEGTRYAWYAMHDDDASRIKMRDNCDEWWWTRSPGDQLDPSRSPDFCRVSKDGTPGNGDPAYVGGVAICFCI